MKTKLSCFPLYIAISCIAAPGYADTLYVNKAAGLNGIGNSWTSPYISIQNATANASPGDEIWIAKAVYYTDEGTVAIPDDPAASITIPDGVALLGGFNGTESSPLDRDCSTNPTVLSGDIGQDDINKDVNGVTTDPSNIVGQNAYTVVMSSHDSTGTKELDCLIITGGSAIKDGGAGIEINGGGGHFTGGNITLRDVQFTGCQAKNAGGGLYLARLIAIMERLSFNNNKAWSGGGVHAEEVTTAKAEELLYTHNEAEGFGGAIALDRSEFRIPSIKELMSIVAHENTAGDSGGFLFGVRSEILLRNGIAEKNTANKGGALYLALSKFVGVNFVSSQNVATGGGQGGNLYLDESEGTFHNSTSTRNRAEGIVGQGGDVFVGFFSRLTSNNSLSKGNNAESGKGIFNFGVCEYEYSGIEEVAGTPCTDKGNNINASTLPDFTVGDGPSITTNEWHSQPSSKAIDSGSNGLIPENTPFDLNGDPRIVNGTVDMGATEYRGEMNFRNDDFLSHFIPALNAIIKKSQK